MFYRVQNSLSLRHKDQNGYLFVDKSPILKTGVLEYLGSELLPEDAETDTVDGVKIDKDKIYKVFIPLEELEKAKDTFKLLPITDDHIWLGSDGEDAKDYQEGTIGENVYIEDGYLYAPLKFTGSDIISKIESHEKEELSTSYYNRFAKSDNPEYDFIAKDIKGNHLALVDKGRCGADVRVLNSKIRSSEMAEKKSKSSNKAILELDGKRVDLDQFFEQESEEEQDGEKIHAPAITENEDKREIIREIMAIAGKADEEFEGGEDEKVRKVAELAEKLAYNPSEDSKEDNKCSNECEEEKTENEEPEEEKAEEPSEEKTENEECEEKPEETKAMNYDALFAKISNSIKAEQEKQAQAMVKAYNAARGVLGDFNPFGLNEKEIYVKALNHLGVDVDGKESVAELASMLKACSAVRSRVDNGFSYGVDLTDEVEFHI